MNDSVSDTYDSAHDPLCPVCRATDGLCNSNCASCLCYLIAKVREDERSKDLDYAYVAAHAEADGQRDMLAKCIAAINESCEWRVPDSCPSHGYLLKTLRGLQEKP